MSRQLTEAERSRIERNRQRALYLKQAKLVKSQSQAETAQVIKIHGGRFKDSGGGFLIEEDVGEELISKTNAPTAAGNKEDAATSNGSNLAVVHTEATHPVHYEECLECADPFFDSYLMVNFSYAVCDNCRDPQDKHSLITKTEAKAEYLLQDHDFEKREPPLRFILKKNPHNSRWGDMKLYLHVLVEKRALEVWGSEEALRQQHEQREEKRERAKSKSYNKRLKELRMDMRSTLYDRTHKATGATHKHVFGPDTYNEADDNYTHTCLECPYSETFEKM